MYTCMYQRQLVCIDFALPFEEAQTPFTEEIGFGTGRPWFDPQSRHDGHGGLPLGKAHF